MPRRPDFILEISIRNIEDFSPDAIAKSPRTFRPIDVQNACRNLSIKAPGGTPAAALALAHYIAIDFFMLAHSTGLYNRQIKLWESLAKTSAIEIHQKRKGIFSSEKLPEFDLYFFDHKKRPMIAAHYAQAHHSSIKFDYLKSCKEFFKRVSAVQGLNGVFVSFPGPFPEKVLDFIRKQTNANNSIAKYESVFPGLGLPVNMLELEQNLKFDPESQMQSHKIRLVHPDLGRKKSGSTIPGMSMSSLDQSPFENQSSDLPDSDPVENDAE